MATRQRELASSCSNVTVFRCQAGRGPVLGAMVYGLAHTRAHTHRQTWTNRQTNMACPVPRLASGNHPPHHHHRRLLSLQARAGARRRKRMYLPRWVSLVTPRRLLSSYTPSYPTYTTKQCNSIVPIDSKQLTADQREKLFADIKNSDILSRRCIFPPRCSQMPAPSSLLFATTRRVGH